LSRYIGKTEFGFDDELSAFAPVKFRGRACHGTLVLFIEWLAFFWILRVLLIAASILAGRKLAQHDSGARVRAKRHRSFAENIDLNYTSSKSRTLFRA
jgi:hypothetical protein